MSVRFYTSAGPAWWPFQVVSLSNGRLPGSRRSFYRIIIDNGAFRFYSEGRRPDPDIWLSRLAAFAGRVESVLRPLSIVVVLPDWPGDPGFTVGVARSSRARWLCRRYSCMAVAHAAGSLGGYGVSAGELASIDWVDVVGAPLKLPCSWWSRRARRRYVDRSCQVGIARQVARGAGEYGVSLHGLAPLLVPAVLRELAGLGYSGFDSASWTRPVNGGRVARWSAKSSREREEFFLERLSRLVEAGVPLELPELPSRKSLLAAGVVGSG